MTRAAPNNYTDEQKTEALALYQEHGASEAARLTGIKRVTISQWAHRAQVTSDIGDTAAQLHVGARARWNVRRAVEADHAGTAAEKARKALLAALAADKKDSALIRALATAYQTLVATANLLAGEPTSQQPPLPNLPTGDKTAPTPQDAVLEGRRLALQLVTNPPEENP